MRILSLTEAAQFLRMSRSNLYQRKDIPRYRRPGSRVMLFDQDELETWLKQGRTDPDEPHADITEPPSNTRPPTDSGVMDNSPKPVYHRRARYR